MTQAAIDEFKASLDQMGEPQVRRILEREGWNAERKAIALQWLSEQDDTRQARQSRSAIAWAKSAAFAGWLAAGLSLLGLVATLLK